MGVRFTDKTPLTVADSLYGIRDNSGVISEGPISVDNLAELMLADGPIADQFDLAAGSYDGTVALVSDLAGKPNDTVWRVVGETDPEDNGIYKIVAGSPERLGPLPGTDLSAVEARLDVVEEDKAEDDEVVKLAGDQTIADVKTFSSSPVVPDASFTIAKTDGLQAALESKAADAAVVKLAGAQTIADIKTFSSGPLVPTAAPGTNTTQAASTAFTTAAVSVETAARIAADLLLAPLASPALTGTPTAPTATEGTNTTQIATTAFAGAEAEARITARIADEPTVLAGTNDTELVVPLTLAAKMRQHIDTTVEHDDDDVPSIVFQDEDGFTVGAFPIPLASEADAIAGSDDVKPMTSRKVAVAINEHITVVEDDSDTLPSVAFVDEDGYVIATLPATDTAASSSDLPDASGGYTLFAWRSLSTNLLLNSTGIIPILITGDSWTERPAITQSLKDALTDVYGESGYGWISCDDAHNLTGLTQTQSGWTLYDASADGAPDPTIGSAHDGKAISATGTSAVVSITVQCQNFKIAYRDGDGTFRYRVDGGSWTSVVGAETGDVEWVTLSGLSDASHTIEIDLTGNTGEVVIYGYIARRTAAGIEFHKCGNGSIDGSQIETYLDQMPPFLEEIAPALVIIFLGTNDYRRPNAFSTFTGALTGIVENVRAAYPNAGIIFCGPADTDGTAIVPLTDYVAEMYRLSEELGCAFFNDNKLSGTWEQSDDLGEMDDALHKSTLGGQVTARNLIRTLL